MVRVTGNEILKAVNCFSLCMTLTYVFFDLKIAFAVIPGNSKIALNSSFLQLSNFEHATDKYIDGWTDSATLN